MTQTDFDVVIIGGGAAGLMACGSANRTGMRVMLLEKNKKLGVKILMSGGTRCNITHACSPREISAEFGPAGRFLHSPLTKLTPNQIVEMIELEGVPTKTESGGKIFPMSDRAIDVRDALVRIARGSTPGKPKAEIKSATACRRLIKSNDQFQLSTDDGNYTTKSVIITTGGKSYPGCGTTGDGYEWARSFGHQVVPPVPALTPIVSKNNWSNELSGITIPDAGVRVTEVCQGKIVAKRKGGFLFTHFGFSGPSVLDVSKSVSIAKPSTELVLDCDFVPSMTHEKLMVSIKKSLSENSRQQIANIRHPLIPGRLWEKSLDVLSIPRQKKAAEVSRADMIKISNHFKSSRFPINQTFGFDKAEVTAGGVNLDEVDSRTMGSKIISGLFFAGEILDLDGPIGGYNFQAAFSTGWVAGINAVEYCNGDG